MLGSGNYCKKQTEIGPPALANPAVICPHTQINSGISFTYCNFYMEVLVCHRVTELVDPAQID